MCSITELGFVRVLAPPQCGASLFFTCALCCSGRRAEAPPLDLRYAGSSQTYLEPGFAESATVPVAL